MVLHPDFAKTYPDTHAAPVSREQAARLAAYDHHRVFVNGRPGVMLTYHWPPPEEAAGPKTLLVVFHHADAHPAAPPEVQAVVDTLTPVPYTQG